jgi:vacuolar-type H+-ATPase subunit H
MNEILLQIREAESQADGKRTTVSANVREIINAANSTVSEILNKAEFDAQAEYKNLISSYNAEAEILYNENLRNSVQNNQKIIENAQGKFEKAVNYVCEKLTEV